jgi:hypothetical protein
MIVRSIYLLALALVLASAGWSAAAGAVDPLDYAYQYLDGLGARGFKLTPVEDDDVAATFPGLAFFAVVFRQYPVVVEPPEGLSPSDLIVVVGDKVIALDDPDDLKGLFLALLPPVADADGAAVVTRAWLRLTAVFSQDGFFSFADPVVTKVKDLGEGTSVHGQIAITAGGKGKIHAVLTFDADGDLTDVREVRNVHVGSRPI